MLADEVFSTPEMRKSMMHIFVATNDGYYPRLKVFANTLAKHNDDVYLTILYADLSPKNRADFAKFAKKIRINCRFVSVDEQRSGSYKLIHQITVETYYRFLLLDIYPTQDRAMWMDIDAIVTGDLSKYYYDDFEDNYVMACPGNNVAKHLKRLNLRENGCYFNAGMIIFNLEKIRQDFNNDFLYAAYEENESRILFSDQDVLNIVFADKIKAEPNRRFNYIITSGQKLPMKEVKRIAKENVVVHYIRHIKPWQYYYQGNARFLYLREMAALYPFRALGLVIAGELYKLKRNKKTLENSIR
jgi:lipopolysaccharide biosynthesis glycosyltransferase